LQQVIDPVVGLTKEQALNVAARLGFSDPKLQRQAAKQIELLYTLFWNNDCTLVEVNPFAETSDGSPSFFSYLTELGEVICMDSKINFDTNAIFRHPEFNVLRDTTQEDPRDVQAHEHDLNYIGIA
jgi:succinyl-CoA synthetase beta subunit